MVEKKTHEEQGLSDPTAAAIDRLAQAVIAGTPKQQDPLDLVGISAGRKNLMKGLNPDGSARVAPRWRDIECKSPFTGALILVHVVESKAYVEHGRIVSFSRYRHPAEAYIHEEAGGLVPNGLKMFKADSSPYVPPGSEPVKESLTVEFLEWRWKAFAQRDQLNFGARGSREMKAHYCVDPDGIKTPWKAGTIAGGDELSV